MKNFRSILFSFVGVLSILLAIVCFNKNTGSWASSSIYGGDAFTGIQNASAKSANNVQTLSEIVRFGFGSVLLVGGLVLLVVAIPEGKKSETNSELSHNNEVKTSNNENE